MHKTATFSVGPNDDEVIRDLRREGYVCVLPWHAEPGEMDFEHAHKADSKQVILGGEITLFVDGQNFLLQAGETFTIPATFSHSAVAGPAGCYYVFALK